MAGVTLKLTLRINHSSIDMNITLPHFHGGYPCRPHPRSKQSLLPLDTSAATGNNASYNYLGANQYYIKTSQVVKLEDGNCQPLRTVTLTFCQKGCHNEDMTRCAVVTGTTTQRRLSLAESIKLEKIASQTAGCWIYGALLLLVAGPDLEFAPSGSDMMIRRTVQSV